MTLAAGTKLGSYEIVSPLGAGWMGEVYRATNKKVNRDFAIKVIPQEFLRDEQRPARFEREAQRSSGSSRVTEISVWQHGRWTNPGWHTDEEK